MSRGNDVCALCDRVIDHRAQAPDFHRYLGAGWAHGAGVREFIAVHHSCATEARYRIPGWVPEADFPEWLSEWRDDVKRRELP